MRMMLSGALALLSFLVSPDAYSADTALAADSGKQIKSFLEQMARDRWPVDFYHLDTTQPIKAGPRPPGPPELAQDPGPLTLVTEKCVDEPRAALATALDVRPLTTVPPKFVPDYCIIHIDAERKLSALWIDTDPSRLQMQLFVSGGDQPVDASGIQANVRDGLSYFLIVAQSMPVKAYRHIVDMIVKTDRGQLPIELMSIDPKPAGDVVGEKRWNVIGKVSIPKYDKLDRDAVIRTLNYAKDSGPPDFRMPRYTAHVFTPRLAVSVSIPTGDPPPAAQSRKYVLLMSFECRLAELYIDHQFRGCCAIQNVYPIDVARPELGLGIGADQFLNNILVSAGKQLKPKTASSGN